MRGSSQSAPVCKHHLYHFNGVRTMLEEQKLCLIKMERGAVQISEQTGINCTHDIVTASEFICLKNLSRPDFRLSGAATPKRPVGLMNL